MAVDDLGERLPVVAVLVRGDDGRDAVVTDQPSRVARVVGRVDQELLVGGPAAQQIGVVVHRADRDLGDHQVRELVHIRRSADLHRSAVRHVPPAYSGGSDGQQAAVARSAPAPSRRPASQPSRSAPRPVTVTPVSPSAPPPVVHRRPSAAMSRSRATRPGCPGSGPRGSRSRAR